jgi:hypothetical protein
MSLQLALRTVHNPFQMFNKGATLRRPVEYNYSRVRALMPTGDSHIRDLTQQLKEQQTS